MSRVQTLMYAAATDDYFFIIIDECVGKRTDMVLFSEVSKHCVKVRVQPILTLSLNVTEQCCCCIATKYVEENKQKSGVGQPFGHNYSSRL